MWHHSGFDKRSSCKPSVVNRRYLHVVLRFPFCRGNICGIIRIAKEAKLCISNKLICCDWVVFVVCWNCKMKSFSLSSGWRHESLASEWSRSFSMQQSELLAEVNDISKKGWHCCLLLTCAALRNKKRRTKPVVWTRDAFPFRSFWTIEATMLKSLANTFCKLEFLHAVLAELYLR